MVHAAIEDQLFSDKLSGKTPHQTMKAKISVDIRRKGIRSLFFRTAPGRFFLRSLLDDPSKVYEAEPLQASPATEKVLVFPSKWLDRVGRFQGIRRAWRSFLVTLIKESGCTHMSRMQAEQTEAYKQVLTYTMVTRGNEILAFKRGTFNRVEDYLRGSNCIGFGGHVSEFDKTLYNLRTDLGIADNAKRELFEEVVLPQGDREKVAQGDGLKIVGLLNDDSSPTGRRHFAVLFRYQASATSAWDFPLKGEKSITQLRWLSLEVLSEELRTFEYWSQLCLTEFFPNSIKGQPTYRIRRRAPLRPPHLLCVVGSLGSGKSVATEVLKDEFGYREVNSGKVVAEILGIPPVPETPRDAFQKRAWKFIRRPEGPARLARTIWDRVEAERTNKVLIDGIRQKRTFEELRKLASGRGVGLLYVHTPPNVAYQFYRDRIRGQLTIQQFLRLSDSPVEAEVRNMIGMADAILYNWTGELRYKKMVRRLIRDARRDESKRERRRIR
jgi:predicted NUDIX family phosphoesterase/dephospho-CoA kinase